MNKNSAVTSVAVLVATGAVISTLLTFMVMQEKNLPLWYPVLWLCLGPMLYGGDGLFLRRERNLQSLIGLNTLVGVAFVTGLLFAGYWDGMTDLLVLLGGCGWICYRAANLYFAPVRLSTVVQWLDITLIVLMLYLAYLGALGLPLVRAIPMGIGCCGAVLGVMDYRAGGTLAARDWGLLGLLLAGIFGLACVVTNTLVKGAGQGLGVLFGAVKGAFLWIYRAFYRFMLWLATLFPQEQLEELDLEDSSTALSTGSGSQSVTVQIPWFVYALVIVLVVGILVYLIHYAGRFRSWIASKRIGGVQVKRRERPSLWQAFCMALAELKESLRLRIYLIRHKNTVLGVFYRLVLATRGRGWRQGLSRTPREFLTALAEECPDEGQRAALLELIGPVEWALYASGGNDVCRAGTLPALKWIKSVGDK